jgi:L-malate glycosyltransferase
MPLDEDVLRLLILTDTAILGAGGSERFLRNLLVRLSAQRYSIDVLQLADEPRPEACVARLENPSIRLAYHPIGAVYGLRGLSAWRRVRAQLSQSRYHIIQSQHEKSDIISALLPRTRGLHKISNRRDMGFQKSARVSTLFRRLNSRFDRIVAPTRAIIDGLLSDENADLARCRTIPNGVDTQAFRPADAAQRDQRRAALGFAANDFLIGCVASYSPVKRHVDLIAALAQVRRENPHVHLLLIGDGPLRGEIQSQIAQLRLEKNVHLLGARADVDKVLPALDGFALASSSEGLSNAILEAQACALPVVATAVGGNPDLVRAGQNGWLVPRQDPQALAAALNEMVRAPEQARQFGANARARAQSEHSLDAMAASYEQLYRELAHAS